MVIKRTVWEVHLDINGPVKIERSFNLIQKKGVDLDQFYSNISIRNSNNGFNAFVTAYAPNAILAYKAAFIYFGKMIDVLSFNMNLPLYQQYHHKHKSIDPEIYKVKKILRKYDFQKSFDESRQIELQSNGYTLLKALSWFRKARLTEDAMDQFVAYWNVIEILGTVFHTKTDRTKKGVINKIYQCFSDYFGEPKHWKFDEDWINKMHEIRSSLVHGGEFIDIEAIDRISTQLETLDITAYNIMKIIKYKNFNFNKTIDEDEF